MQRAATSDDGFPSDAGLLYERYSGRILAYCLHTLRDRGEAEDAVQTTFLQAHRALLRGVTPEHEFAWLHTIATNVCRMQKRTAGRRAVVTGVDLDAFPASGADADDKELLVGLGDALASMPDGQRRALVMREWQGLSSAEVASRMGMSTPATYALLTRARRSLAHGLSTVKGRAALGSNIWPLLPRLKALFAGGAAKLATATAVGVVVVAGGVTVDRALADRPNGPSLDGQSVPGGETSTPISARAVHTSVSTASRPRGTDRTGATAPTRSRTVVPPVQETPDLADAPTAAPPATEQEAPAEPSVAVEVPVATVEEELGDALGAVPELPLPEVGIDLGIDVDAEVDPDEPLPPIDGSGLQSPLPELPPAPELLPLP